jgi:hypothetical protein
MVPLIVPPPFKPRLPAKICNEAPLRLNGPETVELGFDGEVVLIVSEPLLMFRLAAQFTLSTVSDAEVLCVTVMPAWLITTSSEGPGSTPVFQFDGVSQSPPLGLIHETVESKVRDSTISPCGRKVHPLFRAAALRATFIPRARR